MPAFPPLYILVLLPLAAAAAGSFLPRRVYQFWLLLAQLAVVVLSLWLFIQERTDGVLRYLVAGWPEGIAIKLVANQLSTPLVLLTAFFFRRPVRLFQPCSIPG